ncbi:hypothetical protein P691DRAFT_784101 [Macrolepiota fuliginosa MF-IS2]|uniref:Uncharacterized protein n=1 Tax=Macrolepiota fuliginosa MF-IS2 TaxID=1400762 RepID=A0A9P5XBI4_9AGAR|nr:hypothetical protein P691DRAFT_784101 [Macrolepiota fuliginosa MF-IS2]
MSINIHFASGSLAPLTHGKLSSNLSAAPYTAFPNSKGLYLWNPHALTPVSSDPVTKRNHDASTRCSRQEAILASTTQFFSSHYISFPTFLITHIPSFRVIISASLIHRSCLFGPIIEQFPAIINGEAGTPQREWFKTYGGGRGIVKVVGPVGAERVIFCNDNVMGTLSLKGNVFARTTASARRCLMTWKINHMMDHLIKVDMVNVIV